MFIFSTNPTIIITILLLFGMLTMDYLGLKIRVNRNKKNPSKDSNDLGSLEGALLGLLALLLAFTFNLSISRYDARRQAIVEEANDIGTALLRSDLYPDSVRIFFEEDFKQYIEARISYYEAINDETKIQTALNKSTLISQRIWKRVAVLSQKSENILRSMQMIPAINNMIDITTTRDEKRLAHVPNSILYLLFMLCLAASFIIGYGRKDKADWILICCFTVMITMTVYLIIDLDQSRSGIIQTDTAHKKMIELRNLLK